MGTRTGITILLLAAACRGDGRPAVTHVADRTAGDGPTPPPPSPVVEPAPPAGAPPGTARLVPVPAEIAAGVKLVEVVRGLARPVAIVAAPGDARKRLFIVEQHVGRIRILEGGTLAATPFLTVPGLSKGNEQGLLGLAFHPRFGETGRFYVDYTTKDKATHIVEYQVSATSPDIADPATARELVRIEDPYSNHNGGHLLFGPDGRLYAGMGDGGSAGDPEKHGQNPTSLLSKILAFDVDARVATPPAIVHMGLRNPWRFAFDGARGDLYIGDVGQNRWESVFVVPGGTAKRNFGWSVVEGSHCYEAETCDRTSFTPPAAEYSHDDGCSITGGVVYRGAAHPALAGVYFYGDFCTGLLRSLRWTPDPSSPTAPGFTREHWDWKRALDPKGLLGELSSFGVDHGGELYFVTLGGVIYKI